MKKLVVALVVVAVVMCLATSAFAFNLNTLYNLEYKGLVGEWGIKINGSGSYGAGAINMDVYNWTGTATDGSRGTFEQNIYSFCLTPTLTLQGNYVAEYKGLDVTKETQSLLASNSPLLSGYKAFKYMSNDYIATSAQWNAGLQMAIWSYEGAIGSGSVTANLVRDYLTGGTTGTAGTAGGGVIGFDGTTRDPHTQSLSSPVPEASTLIGFGSALVMAGPGMIGWLKRRRS